MNERQLVKRSGFVTQRAKPWHVRRSKEDVSLCGNLRFGGWFRQWMTFVTEMPEGQILCSTCERVEKKS